MLDLIYLRGVNFIFVDYVRLCDRVELPERCAELVRQRFAKPYSCKKRVAGSSPALSASWENANLQRLPRGARRAARLGFERAFLAKKKRIYQSKYGSSRFVLEILSFPTCPQRKAVYPLDSRI